MIGKSLMAAAACLPLMTLAQAEPRASDELPAALLDACDAAAPSYGAYPAPAARGAAALMRLGVFSELEFSRVKVGFCDLVDADGPVATTSCARDIILLDRKYARADQDLALTATLAHEMKHHLQHNEGKARHGADYCESDQYIKYRPRLEEAADRFGDAVAALLYIGRPIAIRNDCAVAVSVYLEPDEARGGVSAPFTIAPLTTHTPPLKATAAAFRFYARSEAADGRRWVWRGNANRHQRKIDGKVVMLRESAFSNRRREDGAFEIRLTCPA